MKLDVFLLIFVGYFIKVSEEGGDGKHVHVKIVVPHVIHKHTHTIHKKVPVHGHEKKHVVIHKHDHKHKHKHDHGHKHGHNHKHKHGHKHDAKHKHKHDHKHVHAKKKHHGWHHYESEPLSHQNDNLAISPFSFDDDGFKATKKSVRSEHYEVQKRKPSSFFPEDEVEVRGSYKVQETDPYDHTTTSYHAYDSPVTKEIAQALTGFGRFQDALPPEEAKQDYGAAEAEGEGEVGDDHGGVAAYDEDDQELQKYEDYGDNREEVEEYVAGAQGELQPAEGDYNYGSEKLEKYILQRIYGSDKYE